MRKLWNALLFFVAIIVFFLALPISNVSAAEQPDVAIKADVRITGRTLTGEVKIVFANQSLYNNQVKLSWHIYDTKGNLLQFENDRYQFSIENGLGTVKIDTLLPILSVEDIVIRFDLVDELNVFWFGDNPSVSIQQCEVNGQIRPGRVELTADFDTQLTKKKIEGNITLQFENPEECNDQIKLSWHVFDENGERLIFDNERLNIPALENGTCSIPVSIDLSSLDALSGVNHFTVLFDLVDEKNAFWYSEQNEMDFDTVATKYNTTVLENTFATLFAAARNQPALLILNIIVDGCIIATAVMLVGRYRRSKSRKQTKNASLSG